MMDHKTRFLSTNTWYVRIKKRQSLNVPSWTSQRVDNSKLKPLYTAIIVISLFMENKFLNLNLITKMLTCQLNFVMEVYHLDLVLLCLYCMFLSFHVRVLEWIHTYSCLNVKELLAWNWHKIWLLNDCNWTRTQNQLIRKRTLDHLAKW